MPWAGGSTGWCTYRRHRRRRTTSPPSSRRWRRTARGLAAEDEDLLVLGTDAPALSPGEALHTEIRLLSEAGLSSAQVLRAATRNAAVHLGRGEELGTLEAGELADLIVVDGNPLEDLSALRNVELVVKGGDVVVSHPTAGRTVSSTEVPGLSRTLERHRGLSPGDPHPR